MRDNSSRVIADMFGMALRTYQDRVRRLSESRTFRGKSLWEAVLDELRAKGPLLRADLMQRFRHDDPESVAGVLKDLVSSGLVYRTGKGAAVSYRALESELLRVQAGTSGEGLLNWVWLCVQQHAPLTRTQLQALTALGDDALQHALTTLVERGLVHSSSDPEPAFTCPSCVLPYDDPQGWEAAVFDHYQAMVGALCAKLEQGSRKAVRSDVIGGSTFGFEVWPGHPHYDEVRGLLSQLRQRCGQLRAEVATYNAEHEAPADKERVVTYVGQNVKSERVNSEDEDE